MYIRHQDGMLYIYRNFDLMLESMKQTHSTAYCADYIIVSDDFQDIVRYDEDRFSGKFIKDRSGIFDMTKSVSIKKVLEIINFMYNREAEHDR